MKLYIPEIGDQFKLINDWTFDLYNEQRNKSLWDLYECENSHSVSLQRVEEKNANEEINKIANKYYISNGYRYTRYTEWDQNDIDRYNELDDIRRKFTSCLVKIPKDSILKLDRIFIRKGMDDWSSLTFYLTHHPDISFKKKPRFWAKLHDCNNIEFDQVST
jgi:hypothetical protein